MTEHEFRFIDHPPPQRRGRNTLYAAFRDALRSRPGEWAIWPAELKDSKSARATAANLERGREPWFPKGAWESQTSGTTVYVRYLGSEQVTA